MLTKLELEKLKVNEKLLCTLENGSSYYLKIIKTKWFSNGVKIYSEAFLPEHLTNDKKKSMIQGVDRVFTQFTINGAFRNEGSHNPGKQYVLRYYTYIEKNENSEVIPPYKYEEILLQ